MNKYLFPNPDLIWSFTRRNLLGRYRGSFLGIFWSFINPIFMLIIYTVVFSKILQIKFGTNGNSTFYALYLFCGMIPWLAFSETLNHATSVILENVNLVKKTVFPLEILPVSSAIAGFIHSLFGLFILLGGIMVIGNHVIYPTILLLPVVVIPQLLLTAGIGWFLSSLSVFVRDMVETTRIGLTAWMFLTPIFYPVDIIPEKFRFLIFFNPMAVIVDGYRKLLLDGTYPDWRGIAIIFIVGFLSALSGFLWFIRTKRAFAEAI